MGGVTLLAQASGSEPAGGAAAAEAIGATAGALVVTTLIALVIAAHRSRRINWLHRLARFAERQTGLPSWAALPSALMGLSLLTAALGMYWDISLHIDNGRDDGPLANPAHYLILVGLYGSLLAGALSIALAGHERPCRTAINLGGDWWAPLGGLMIAACGAFALTGFPLDDLWHRIFGQDVTLWGPTHLMLIGGGSLAVLGGMVLFAEGIRTVGRDPERERSPAVIYHLRRGLLVGGFLVALSTFQGEFDFGVPQFRLVLHPILIMLAASIGLVATRIYLGRGGALLAAVGFIAIRGFIAIMVGGVWDQTLPHFPLYLVEALLVELVFLRSAGRSPVAIGALAGVLIGTIGLAAEWGWSHVWMPISWPASLLPETAVAGLVSAVAGGAVGAFIGSALSGGLPSRMPAALPARLGAVDRRAALLGAVAVVAVLAWNVPLTGDGPRSATIALRDVQAGPGRTVAADIRIDPPAAVGDNPEFLNVTAWQGGGSVLDPLERTGPGEYRTTEPIPVYGGWKATLRLQQGSSLVAVPLFQPLDRAIPAPETPASPAFTRGFRPDIDVLQRERKQDVAPALSAVAYLTVLAIALSLFALIAWSLLRLDAGGPRRRVKSRTAPSRAELV
jgi:hypothetical protein